MGKTASVLASLLIAASAVLSVVSGFSSTYAQATDSPEVRQLLDDAQKNAGTEWADAFAKERR